MILLFLMPTKGHFFPINPRKRQIHFKIFEYSDFVLVLNKIKITRNCGQGHDEMTIYEIFLQNDCQQSVSSYSTLIDHQVPLETNRGSG